MQPTKTVYSYSVQCFHYFVHPCILMPTALHSPVVPCLIYIGCSRHTSLRTASGNPSHSMECHPCNNGISFNNTARQTFIAPHLYLYCTICTSYSSSPQLIHLKPAEKRDTKQAEEHLLPHVFSVQNCVARAALEAPDMPLSF